MKEKFYIIDGSGYIFRAYYAIQQSLMTKAGLPTNALYGFTKMLLSFLSKVIASEKDKAVILMVFDAARKNFRHDIYTEYKANRIECPEDLIPQMPYFRKIAQALGFQVLEKEGYEADDLIATIIKNFECESKELVIVSADKDLTQLVTKDVKMWDPMRDKLFDEESVLAHFGVRPDQIADYLSIVGDTSDNIPGAKGIGPKTVSQLFQHFSNLDDLLNNLGKVAELPGLRGAKGVQAKLESNIDLIRLSRRLVSLDKSVPLEVSDIKWNGYINEELKALVTELEFESIFKKIPLDDRGPDMEIINARNYKIVSSQELLEILITQTLPNEIAFDTETDSLDPLTARLMGISLSWKDEEAYYLPCDFKNVKSVEFNEILKRVFHDDQILKYGSNLKYDLRVLDTAGIEVKGPFFDTMIASQILDPNTRENGLKGLALKLLLEQMVSYTEMLDGAETIYEVPLERLGKYAAHDADASLRIGKILKSDFKKDNYNSQEKLFEKVEMPLMPVLAKMEQDGIKINEKTLIDMEVDFLRDAERLQASIIEHAGESFNLNSPKQLATVLFEKLNLPTYGVKKNQSGYSTDAGVLQRMRGVHPIIDDLLEYREVYKLLTTYLQGLRKIIHPKSGRIHTSYNQAVTTTGRLSSSDPNLQNIPIRSERGKKIRQLFIAEEGSKLLIADYSQIELRILAHLSQDENLISAFKSEEDIHLRTAKELFGIAKAYGEDAGNYRRIAKTINFGIIYGMGSFRLSGDLGVSKREAQEFIDTYFNRYPKVKVYFDQIEKTVQSQGYIETLFGRRRYLEEVNSKGRDKGYAVRSMMNAPIQGAAAEIVKLAMISISQRISEIPGQMKMLLQVHDELICEVKQEFSLDWQGRLRDAMENVVQLDVPLKIDLMEANNWGEKK